METCDFNSEILKMDLLTKPWILWKVFDFPSNVFRLSNCSDSFQVPIIFSKTWIPRLKIDQNILEVSSRLLFNSLHE